MKFRSIITNTGLVFFGLALALCVGEIFLRIIPYQPAVLIPPYLYDNDPNTWWALRPGFSSEQQSLDGAVTYTINNQGIRSSVEYTHIDVNLPNEERPTRVFIIGDSFTFGWGVEEQHTYAHILEKLLLDQNINYEIVNLGVPGFGTKQSYLRLLDYSSTLGEPDIVIYMFVQNDPVDNLVGKKVVVNGIRMDEQLRFKYLTSLVAKVYRYSRVLSLTLDTYYSRRVNPRLVKQQSLSNIGEEDRADVTTLLSAIEDLQNWTDERDIKLLIATSSESEYSPILRQFLREEKNIPMLESQTYFEAQSATIEKISLEYDGHWNRYGHQLVAEALEGFLLENEWERE